MGNSLNYKRGQIQPKNIFNLRLLPLTKTMFEFNCLGYKLIGKPHSLIQIIMSTETPTTIEQTMTLLFRLSQRLQNHLQISEQSHKRDSVIYHSQSPLYQMAAEIQHLVKLQIKRYDEDQRAYELQLQKLQERLRRHAKSQCEMKLYCEHIQQEMKNMGVEKRKIQEQFNLLTSSYNKQIESLKTQLSNAVLLRNNDTERRADSERQQSARQTNTTLSKIKLRLMNMGTVQYDEPQSCINTLRKSIPYVPEEQHPHSQPTSYENSPTNSQQKSSKDKPFKRKKNSKKGVNSRSKSKISKDQLQIKPIRAVKPKSLKK